MRNNIFYWKCDCQLDAEDKKKSYFSDKYAPEKSHLAIAIAQDFLGKRPLDFKNMNVDGNHYAYHFSDGKQKFLLRTDDGETNDNYILAESAILEELNQQKMPVPRIYKTDVSKAKYPVAYQIMDFVKSPSLFELYRNDELDMNSIASEFGAFLSQLHSLKYPKFGFIDVAILEAEKRFCGIDQSWKDYFNKCLNKHFAYLYEHNVIDNQILHEIENIFADKQEFLELEEASLLHRDFAYWNILGTDKKITAVIDWDDSVLGDPADDLGIVNCFNSAKFMETLLEAYNVILPINEKFKQKIHFYTLRNMLWKCVIRHYMGYFDKDKIFFLCKNELNLSLKDYSINKIKCSIKALEK